ncbi:MAG: hypothetical protein GVY25_04655 [Bacteroidetes bacterium]|jgi:hypothetical protein|nr:hypothetical protein [Bacteroidota bacterium]
MAIAMFVFGGVVLAIGSLMSPAPDPEAIADYTFTQEIFKKDLLRLDRPWYEDIRYQSCALTGVMLMTILYFW